MVPDWLDLRDILGADKRCGPCARERGQEIQLEATQVYDPTQCMYVDAWECPECGWAGYRGDDPGMIAPDGERL